MKAIIFHNELIQTVFVPVLLNDEPVLERQSFIRVSRSSGNILFWSSRFGKRTLGPKDGTKPNPLTFSGSGNLTAAIGKSACRRGPLDFVVSARNIF